MAYQIPDVVVFESLSATPGTDISTGNGYVSIVGANKTLKIRSSSILRQPLRTANASLTAQAKTLLWTEGLAANEWTKVTTKRLDDGTTRSYTHVAAATESAATVATAMLALLEADTPNGHFFDASGDGASLSTATITVTEGDDKVGIGGDGLGIGGFSVQVDGYATVTVTNTIAHVEPGGTLAEVQAYYPSAAQTNYDRFDTEWRDDNGTIRPLRIYAFDNSTTNNFDVFLPQVVGITGASAQAGTAKWIDATTSLGAGDSGGIFYVKESAAAHYTIQLPQVKAGLSYTFFWDTVDGTGNYDVTIAQSTSDTNNIVNVNIVSAGATQTRVAADGVLFDSSAAPVRGDKVELHSDGVYWYGWALTDAASVVVAYDA